MAFINNSAADSIFRISGKIIGGGEIVGLFTILSIGMRADNRLAGKSKYEAPENQIQVIIVFY